MLDWVLWSFGRPLSTPFNAMDATTTAPPLDDPLDPFDNVNRYEPGAVLGNFHVGTCAEAFALLSKTPIPTGTPSRKSANKGSASDPVFNMVAQFLAVKLNIQVGADPLCLDDDPDGPLNPLLSLIAEADKILADHNFNGTTYTPLSGPEKTRLNQLATIFDDYNNNDLVCPIP